MAFGDLGKIWALKMETFSKKNQPLFWINATGTDRLHNFNHIVKRNVQEKSLKIWRNKSLANDYRDCRNTHEMQEWEVLILDKIHCLAGLLNSVWH